jgi:hypothetical protein
VKRQVFFSDLGDEVTECNRFDFVVLQYAVDRSKGSIKGKNGFLQGCILEAFMVPSWPSHVTYLAMCAGVAASGASTCSSQKSKYRRMVLLYMVAVLGGHVACRRARVLAPSTYEPKILVIFSFIVSIHGSVLAVTSTMYLGRVLLGRCYLKFEIGKC